MTWETLLSYLVEASSRHFDIEYFLEWRIFFRWIYVSRDKTFYQLGEDLSSKPMITLFWPVPLNPPYFKPNKIPVNDRWRHSCLNFYNDLHLLPQAFEVLKQLSRPISFPLTNSKTYLKEMHYTDTSILLSYKLRLRGNQPAFILLAMSD